VDELYKETGFYSEVIDKLNADKTLAEPVRKVALQIANSRLWEDARKLKEQSWEVVRSPGGQIEAYRLALGKAEMANRLEPNDRSILHNLGIAQYRVGAYQDALNTLTRAEKMLKNQPIFAKFAFIAKAMVSHKLGQYEHAEVALQQLRDFRKDEQFAELVSLDEEIQAFLAEAEKLLAGEEQ
jgi:tetratricopeptide (TPR) repeat protein